MLSKTSFLLTESTLFYDREIPMMIRFDKLLNQNLILKTQFREMALASQIAKFLC